LPKKKEKKISAKKQKYAKFKKAKPDNVGAFTSVDDPEMDAKSLKDEETRVEKFFRFTKNHNPHEINPRREVSKR